MQRFNVELTRAKSKLIVIGCPHVLCYDSKWLDYMELCQKNNAFFGTSFAKRTTALKNDIIKRMNKTEFQK